MLDLKGSQHSARREQGWVLTSAVTIWALLFSPKASVRQEASALACMVCLHSKVSPMHQNQDGAKYSPRAPRACCQGGMPKYKCFESLPTGEQEYNLQVSLSYH